jgi:hypothetical protein
MSLSCCEKMIIEDENKEILPDMKRMKLTSSSTPLKEVKRATLYSDPKENLKKMFSNLSDEVSTF